MIESAASDFRIGLVVFDDSRRDDTLELLRASELDPAATAGALEDLVAERLDFDVAILALDPGASDGVHAIRDAVVRLAPTPVIVVTSSDSPRSRRLALDAGADGLVLESDVDAALLPTIAATVAGQVVVPKAMRRSFTTPALSIREKQILGLVVLGHTNAQIAQTLFLAESTVKSHLSSCFEKLGVRSRQEAASVIVNGENGLGAGILAISEPGTRRITA